MSRIATTGAVAVLCGLAVLAPPSRYAIDGVSMAPGLQPGDVVATGWFRSLDRLRQPLRNERWILTSPDGTPAIKRVVGLPGETISIRHGDIAIDGQVLLTPPRMLADVASSVTEATSASATDDDTTDGWHRLVTIPDAFDDAAFAPKERRMLLPVRDVGLAAVIRLRTSPPKDMAVRVRLGVGHVVLPWRIKASGRYAVVAGRLDGRLVGAAWPIGDGVDWDSNARSCLPPLVPAAWDVAEIQPDGLPLHADSAPPTLALGITMNGMPTSLADVDAIIERSVVWRDILHRPAADGVVEWRLDAHGFFVLGDFPSGSRDSRHWGPLGRSNFSHHARPLE